MLSRRHTVKHTALVIVIVLVAVLLSACAAGPNPLVEKGDDVPGFWKGLWHGLIAPVTFIISLFNDEVGIYEVVNSGGWYNFGFLFGLTALWGGGSGGAAAGRRRRKSL
jgi:hypothetical protein